MADGFQKHFNSYTVRGRANVAKATYATIALLYLVYRVRRGSSQKPSADQQVLAEGKAACTCDKEQEPAMDSDLGVYETDPECAVCRERADRAMTEYDKEQQRLSAQAQQQEEEVGCHDEPPPPPPPSQSPPSSGGAGASPPRRKCPCDEPKRNVEGALKTSHTSAEMHQQYQYEHTSTTTPQTENVHPASEIMGQVHEAVYRAVRSVIGAVMGGASMTNGHSSQFSGSEAGQEDDITPRHTAGKQSTDEEDNDEEVPLQRRTAPRSCVASDQEMGEEKQDTQPEPRDQVSAEEQQAPKDQFYRFADGFASDMYFNSDE